MRILFTSLPAAGHLIPLLPLAREARARGHDVRIGSGDGAAGAIEAAGFERAPMGPPSIGAASAAFPQIEPLTGRDRARATWRLVFTGPMADGFSDGVLALAESWRPDVVVREDAELGSWIAAEKLGIPHVTVQATAWRPWTAPIAAEPLGRVRARHGLPPNPGLEGLYRNLFLVTRPPSLRDPAAPLPPTAFDLRPTPDDRIDGEAAALPPRTGRPRAAVTLGTIASGRVDLIRTMVEGLAEAGIESIVALGADPATVGPVPEGVRVERYVPMSSLLPASDLVAFHGGSGTMLAALASAVPMVVVPLAADQPDNAELCVAAGVAAAIHPASITPAAVGQAARAVLEPSYRERVAALRDEIEAMPGPEAALDRIEALA